MFTKIIVTGAAGFLGGRTAKYLSGLFPEATILATSRRAHRATELEDAGVTFVAGDLCDPAFCMQLTRDADAIVHCAALSAPFGNYTAFLRSNLIATQQLLEAAENNGVKRFIFISTPSIYFNYADRLQVTENDPLPSTFVNHYASTKWMAEKWVLDRNGKGIHTLALRPRAIIGAEDTVILPRVLEAHAKGKLRIVGDGKTICDFTCVRNIIEAIVCSLNASEQAFGEAYNICDDDPMPLWEAIRHTLTQLDLPVPTRKVPKQLALTAATCVETWAKWFHPEKEPPITRYGIGILAHHFTMDIRKAKDTLGYRPVMRTLEGINEYVEWHRNK